MTNWSFLVILNVVKNLIFSFLDLSKGFPSTGLRATTKEIYLNNNPPPADKVSVVYKQSVTIACETSEVY